MSYKITYFIDTAKKRRLNYQIPIVIMVMIMALTNAVFFFCGQEIPLREYLFPWVKPEIKEAFSAFVVELEDGESVIACFESFWADVFDESNGNP